MIMPQKSVDLPFVRDFLQQLSSSRCKPIPSWAFTFKVILIGNPGVGKTSLLLNFAESRLPAEYQPTLGVNIITKVTHIRRDTEIKWIIWDVGCQRRMEHLRKALYNGAAAVLLVFDKTNPTSLEALETLWLKEIIDAKVNLLEIPVIVVANKVDLATQDATLIDTARTFTHRKKIHFIETSALTGKNVGALFEYISLQCLPDSLKSVISIL